MDILYFTLPPPVFDLRCPGGWEKKCSDFFFFLKGSDLIHTLNSFCSSVLCFDFVTIITVYLRGLS